MPINSQHVNNTKEFVKQINNIRLEEVEYITSYDVTGLFLTVQVASVIDLRKNRLENDRDIPNTTIMSANNIIELLEFCLNNTYFLF